MRRLIAFCLAWLAATAAAAENWVRVGGDADVGEYVDDDSVRRAGDEVRFRRELRFAAPQPEGFDRMGFSSLASCRDRTVAVVAMSFHLAEHELMAATFREEELTSEPAASGSPAARALAYACDRAVAG